MAHTEHTPWKLVIDGEYIIGDIISPEEYDGTQGIVIADYNPETEYLKPSERERKANAARIVTCWNEYDALKAENEKVKRLLHDLTPGGSEFYNDPEYCAKWIRESRTDHHYDMLKVLKSYKEENEALKERVQKLEAAGKAILDSWLKGTQGEIEQFKNSELGAYWSPAAAMVESGAIAELRKLLNP